MPEEMQSEISIQNVKLVIEKTVILDGISMNLEKGKIYGLIGRNGSGKTMLMKCVCGFVRPTAGEIRVQGKRIGTDVDFPENIGLIIENPGFIPYYSGWKNLKMLADINRRITREQIADAMRLTGLDPGLKRHTGKYSLGMRQRLGIAQAVMEDPDILILDEPMNGLDKDGVADMRKVFLQMKEQGKTMLIASHNADDVKFLCDHVWEMEKGRAEQLR